MFIMSLIVTGAARGEMSSTSSRVVLGAGMKFMNVPVPKTVYMRGQPFVASSKRDGRLTCRLGKSSICQIQYTLSIWE